MAARVNDGYLITQVKQVAKREFVVGYNPEAEMPYVCWCCENGNYFWGSYSKTATEAVDKMNERFEEALQAYQKSVYENVQDDKPKPTQISASPTRSSTYYQPQENYTSVIGWFGWLLLCWLLPLIGPIIMAAGSSNKTIKNYGILHIIIQLIALILLVAPILTGVSILGNVL